MSAHKRSSSTPQKVQSGHTSRPGHVSSDSAHAQAAASLEYVTIADRGRNPAVHLLTPTNLLSLQRTLGNRATARLLSSPGPSQAHATHSAPQATGQVTQRTVWGTLLGHKASTPDLSVIDPNHMMSAKDFITATGLTRRRLIPRFLVGASYDAIIGFLEEYDNLNQADPTGKQISKRMEVLKDILENITKWKQSLNRNQRNVAPNEDAVKTAVDKLYTQVLDERKKLYTQKWKPGTDPTAGTRDTVDTKSLWQKTKAFFERTGKRATDTLNLLLQEGKRDIKFLNRLVEGIFGLDVLKHLHRTFGVDFRPADILALSGQTLTRDELKELVALIDESLEAEQKLLKDNPQDTLGAFTKAYAHLPPQLKPKTLDPEEVIALKVKKQLFVEAIGKADKRLQKPVKETKWGKTKRYAKTGADKTTMVVAPVTKYGGTGGVVVSKGPSVVGKGLDIFDNLPEMKVSKQDIGKSIGDPIMGVSNIVSSFGDVVGLLRSFFQSDVRHIRSEDPGKRKLAYLSIADHVPSLINTVGSVTSSALKLAGVLGAVGTAAHGVPIVGAVLALVDMCKQIGEGLKRIYHVWNEYQLVKQSRKKAQHLTTALANFGERNTTLGLRAAIEIIADALKATSSIITALDPSGSAATVGFILSTLASITTGIGKVLTESYHAGIRQESERQAETGKKGSAKKVMKNSAAYAATAIIIEARAGNQLAITALKSYGISQETLARSSVETIRKILFHELEEQEDPKTIGQTIMGIAATLGLRDRI